MQIGRAGRDGSESYCHLFLDDADVLRLRSLAHSDGIDASNANTFLEVVFQHQPHNMALHTEDDSARAEDSSLTNAKDPSARARDAVAAAGNDAAAPAYDVAAAPVYGTLVVPQVAEQCDMKEEVMETLLSYLEVKGTSELVLSQGCTQRDGTCQNLASTDSAQYNPMLLSMA